VLGSVGCLGALLSAGAVFLVSLIDYRYGPPFDLLLFLGLIVGGLIGVTGGIVSLWLPQLGGILLLLVGGVGFVAYSYPSLRAFGPLALSGFQDLVFLFWWTILFLWPGFFMVGGAYAVLSWMKQRPKPAYSAGFE
jgi:hypothetical protein